jgi:prophage maintenance system killer protein/predicted XRE-type DNA-binding protein
MHRSAKKNLIIYQSKNGAIELRGDLKSQTLWATQAQIAELFDVDQSVVSRHIRNIFKDGEISEKSNMQKIHIANSDKPVILHSLDVVLGVGYRTNSKVAIEFRKWSTKILREHITKGYTFNRKQISKNYQAFMKSVGDIQLLLPEHVSIDPKAILELIKEFSNTWLSLDAYDKQTLPTIGLSKKSVKLSAKELVEAIGSLRAELVVKGQASDIFAKEKNTGSIEGIVGNVMQSFNNKALYKTIEEKAANLLYFMVKNHPYVDGNKRSGAFAFIWFLRKTKVKKAKNINPNALTALTLLTAESDPKRKDQVVALIIQMLR